jgi:glycerophosphoryl diester phosphodiesterase
VGHRGGFDASLPENSISMFDFTLSQAALKPVAIEFDIRKSASGSLYLMHDSAVDRTTNGTGTITRLTDDYLERLFLKDKQGHLTTEKIPLFADVLKHFRGKNIMLMLDVKGDIIPEVIESARQLEMEQQCILLTFNTKNLMITSENSSKMMISMLVETQNDLAGLEAANMSSSRAIAYISEKTTGSVLEVLQNKPVLLMTDMSEGTRHNAEKYSAAYYRDVVARLHLAILITDYPVFAGNALLEISTKP